MLKSTLGVKKCEAGRSSGICATKTLIEVELKKSLIKEVLNQSHEPDRFFFFYIGTGRKRVWYTHLCNVLPSLG